MTDHTTPTAAAPQAFLALVIDTYRQAHASAVLWIMLCVTVVAFLICLSVGVEGFLYAGDPKDHPEFIPPHIPPKYDVLDTHYFVSLFGGPALPALGELYLHDHRFRFESKRTGVQEATGTLTLGFGAIELTRTRDAADAVRFLEIQLAFGLATSIGLLLAIIWTSGFLPTFLEPSNASVLLVKPIPRWQLLVGKYLGVVIFVAVQAALFVLLTWLALGWKTGVWSPVYFLTVPLMVLQFAILYGFSTMLAVVTRNTVTCAFGTILFYLACLAMNYAHHALTAHAGTPGFLTHVPVVVEAGYWFLPKPADLSVLLFNALDASNFLNQIMEYDVVQKMGAFHPWKSMLASILFAIGCVWIAAVQFNEVDY